MHTLRTHNRFADAAPPQYHTGARAALPTGTVTFLFTDIEGSTRPAERQPQAFAAAQTRHDAIVREAITGHGGQVFRPAGDGFCVAFGTAPAPAGAPTGRGPAANNSPGLCPPVEIHDRAAR